MIACYNGRKITYLIFAKFVVHLGGKQIPIVGKQGTKMIKR